MKPLKIGNIVLKNRLFLSPMVDVTDLAYRMLCRKYGAAMAYTEMIYVDAILHENVKTKQLMKTVSEDKPVGLQVTGNNVLEFKKLAKLDLLRDYDMIDINCGCPSSRIVGNQAGSFLLRNPEKIASIIRILKDFSFVVTAKIRLGFKVNEVMKISKEIEKAGADLLTVHARTAIQRNSEKADWNEIAKVKREVGIPVVGNGGVVDGKSAEKMLEIADGAMIATAAIGNPFVFREVLKYIEEGKENEITEDERVGAFKDYLRLAKKYDVFDLSRAKFLGVNFLKGFEGASVARQELMKCKSFEDVTGCV